MLFASSQTTNSHTLLCKEADEQAERVHESLLVIDRIIKKGELIPVEKNEKVYLVYKKESFKPDL